MHLCEILMKMEFCFPAGESESQRPWDFIALSRRLRHIFPGFLILLLGLDQIQPDNKLLFLKNVFLKKFRCEKSESRWEHLN